MPTATAQDFYRLATLGPGSSPYLVMSTFAQIVNDRLDDVEIQVNATGAATQHALEAGEGQLDFFMWSASVHQNMMDGTAMYAKIPQAPELSKNLRAVFAFPLGLYHITTYADSGITRARRPEGQDACSSARRAAAPPRSCSASSKGATGLKPGEDFEQVSLAGTRRLRPFRTVASTST